ncbi:protein FAM162B-like [Onychostruthus taczanowskii]|uniref:protein FAM162B-like n=1 Tax=Onychostruthus taczanowskii TaxID=356909 RepID=UPI001B807E9B|nr:protein FAM162B-like [Onychostruthus taczanowskii]
MLGRLLGHSPGLWQRVAGPVFRPARAAGSKAKNAQDMALQTADPGKEAFRNDRRSTNFDKKLLVWSGRFKKEEDIPRHISSEVLDTSRNIARIKVCYIMIALTVLGCVTMIIMGKEESIAAKKDQTLLRVNAEKKAKWRAEVEKGQEAAVGKSQ